VGVNSTMMNWYAGFKVLTVVVMKRTVFWDIMSCSLLKVNRCFGGTYRSHLQKRRTGFLLGLFFDSEGGMACFSQMSVDFQQTTRHYMPDDSTL
jgi:hypothetical protein